jgi:class 3 adenylate cyclase
MAESLDSLFSQASVSSNDEITSPENGIISEELEQLSCFSPRVLRRQLLEEMVVRTSADGGSEFQPSLRKFHGALLFVDISGFTQLSQKLDVDNLRKFINAYFKKLIDIVNKYDGEVIKFAGDAMYIVWQTTFSETGIEKYRAIVMIAG